MKKLRMVCCFFFLLFSLLFADDFTNRINQEEIKLQTIRKKLEEAGKKMVALKKSEQNVLEIMSKIDEELSLTIRLLKTLKEKERIVSEEIDKTEKIIAVLEGRVKIRNNILNKRIRVIYKKGQMHTMELLLTAKTFTDAIKRFEYLTIIAEQDKRIYNELVILKGELQERQLFLRTNLDEIKKINIEAAKEATFLENKKKEKKSFLESIKKQKTKQGQLTKEMKLSAKKIELLIFKLEEERKEREEKEGQKNYFEKVVGEIKWPVKGTLISSFGNKVNPKYGTTVKNNGIDIRTFKGTPVHAVAKGRVVYNDRFLGYGNVVLLDHGKGYYTLYAHLQDVNVHLKDTVEKEQIIGTVGDTGSLEGPKLHFEVRKNGKPVDPRPFLQNK